jgi:predicted DCC family thiol-disulfide oxidoreductase YuxK
MNEPSVTVLLLVYDGECPFCSAYSRMQTIRRDVGELKLVDARQDSEQLAEMAALGFDLDEGMVFKMNDEYYFGADALHMLALLSTSSGGFNRLLGWVFRSRICARGTYPILRFFRNLTLKALGKSKING